MKNAPIPLVMDLWSLGHSAEDIADKIGFPDRRHVQRIIAHARSIGDPRAVFHVEAGRLLGRGIKAIERRVTPRQTKYRGFLIVPVLRVRNYLCQKGHPRPPGTPCRVCQNEARKRQQRAERARHKLRQALWQAIRENRA